MTYLTFYDADGWQMFASKDIAAMLINATEYGGVITSELPKDLFPEDKRDAYLPFMPWSGEVKATQKARCAAFNREFKPMITKKL